MSKLTGSSKLQETCFALLHKNQDESVEQLIVNILSFANKHQLQKGKTVFRVQQIYLTICTLICQLRSSPWSCETFEHIYVEWRS
jgi:hypothetical protein